MELYWRNEVPGMDIKRFDRLAKVARVVLTIPHSNAREECLFCHPKIRRDDRANLHLHGTLSSVITVRLIYLRVKEIHAMPSNHRKYFCSEQRKLPPSTIKKSVHPKMLAHHPGNNSLHVLRHYYYVCMKMFFQK